MYKYKDIKNIHFEITERCQAACPMCDRNMQGKGLNPHLSLAELKLEDVKNIFEPNFFKQLESFQFCGNYGDPIVAEDLVEVIEYIRIFNKDVWINVNTNAGAREPEWWQRLAKAIGRRGRVIFSVDGLEDTNHIYRQGVQWDKVKRSMESYIAAGGRARWDFLIFEHNQHQVEEAKRLSEEWGFERFTAKKSSRFIASQASKKKEEHQAFNKKGEETVVIKESDNSSYRNKELDKINLISNLYGSMDAYYDESEIVCKVKVDNNLYISAEGIVLPCCWTAGRMYKWWHKDPKQEQIWKFIDAAGGKEALNAKTNGLEAVFNTNIFENIEKSWSIQGAKNGRLKICAMKCSKDFDPVYSQYK